MKNYYLNDEKLVALCEAYCEGKNGIVENVFRMEKNNAEILYL